MTKPRTICRATALFISGSPAFLLAALPISAQMAAPHTAARGAQESPGASLVAKLLIVASPRYTGLNLMGWTLAGTSQGRRVDWG